MIEKKEPENWLDAHVKESTPDPAHFGYVPLPTNVEGEPQGSVYMAHLRQENTIGSLLNRKQIGQLSGDAQEDYDFTNYVNRIPKNHLNNADKYFGATTDAEFQSITDQLDQEIKDKSLLAANPWKAAAYALDPLDPTTWLPGGTIYKEAKAGAAIARSMMGVGIAASASTGIQEAVLHQNQLTRTMQESIWNTITAGLVGGVFGGIASAFGSRKLGRALDAEQLKTQQRIFEDINDAITPNENLSAASSKIMDGNELARMPKSVAKSMILTPMNRLFNSPFKTARWFGQASYEHSYELVKNASGVANEISLEQQIKNEMRELGKKQIDHMNYYYEMHGVTSKYFKATRKKMQELGTESPLNINLDQFNRAVYEVALTGAEHEVPQINKAATMWRNEFDRIKKQAIDEGLLPEDVTVPNAANYIMIAYNKNKIIEEGGKAARGDGTFAQHVFDQFQASNETTKQFMQSPMYTEAQAQIKVLKENARRLPPEELKKINNQIADIGKKVKALESLKSKRPKEELTKIEDSIKALNEKRNALDKDIKARQADYEKQVKAEMKTHIKSAANYRNKIKASRTKEASLQNKVSLALNKVGEIKGRIKEIKGLTPKKERLQEQLKEAMNNHAELKKQHKDLLNLIKEDEGHIKSNEKRAAELEEIAKYPERSLPELRKKLKDLDDDIAKAHESKKPTPAEIKAHEKAIQELEKERKVVEKSREIPAEEKERLAKEIESIEQRILDEAPPAAKTWDGKLHSVIEGDGVQTTEELIWDQVGQTIDHILGDSDGKLLNPFLSKLGGATKPFKARKLIIDQLQASPWHITDIQKIAEMHNRAMVPAIKMQAFARQHGFKDINDFLLGTGDLIRKEFDAQSAGKTGKAAQKIRADYDRAIEDMQATVQMLQGVYGQGFNVLNSKGAEFFNNVLNWNYSRMLGHMTLSSLPDMARLVMKNPLMDVLAQGIGESFSTVKKISKNDLRAIGYGIETESASQFKSYIEHQGLSTDPSPFTKGLNSLTQTFGNLSLMNPWQDMISNMSGHIAINKLLRIIHNSMEGKATKKDLTLVARLGIKQEHFADIAKFTKDNVYKGTRYADWTNWEIKTGSESNALKSFQAAVSKSIDEILIIPKMGDKPLLLQQKGAFGNISKLMFQFKSYMFAATNRILYSGIQNRNDINFYLGSVAMMGMGMLGYVTSSVFRGSYDELDLSPTNLIWEGVDRSGVLGIFGEAISIGRKQLQLGEVSRYKSRDAFGSVLGPTGGSASELISLFNKINPLSSAKGEWTTKDASIIMKLMPLQNLFYLQSFNRALFHKAAEGLGATRVDD